MALVSRNRTHLTDDHIRDDPSPYPLTRTRLPVRYVSQSTNTPGCLEDIHPEATKSQNDRAVLNISI